jgi:hypothetical protein
MFELDLIKGLTPDAEAQGLDDFLPGQPLCKGGPDAHATKRDGLQRGRQPSPCPDDSPDDGGDAEKAGSNV